MTANVTAIFGTHDEKTLAQLHDVASRAAYAALMADGHVGYIMPIGGVAAFRNQVSVPGVGYDIACGNAAIRTDRSVHNYNRRDLTLLADEIARTVSFGVGRTNRADDAPTDHSLFESGAWSLLPREAQGHNLRNKARSQLGTVGSGNHYVDIFADDEGAIWVGVHFGSRGLGHTIASGFLSLGAGEKWGTPVRETGSDIRSGLSDRLGLLVADESRRGIRICRSRMGGAEGCRNDRRPEGGVDP
ncbi:MAG: RtcB family protein [Gemmatimonadaceae bacterium]